jgi:tetratricopeptide (TPR) repeat protein
MQHTDLTFGRITVAGKEHVTASYLAFGRLPTKKYMIILSGIGYGITAVCTDPEVYAEREKVWDQIAVSLRIVSPVADSNIDGRSDHHAERLVENVRDTLELQLARREHTGLLCGRAYDAVEAGRYSQAHNLLRRCLRDDPDHRLAHKEMAVVSQRLGNRRAALYHRKQVKRIDPSDLGNRRKLVHLLAGSGRRREALRELNELIELMPDDGGLKELKIDLTYNASSNHLLKFVLSIACFLFVGLDAWVGNIVSRAPWLAGFVCLPAAHYLNLAGRWVGLTRKTSNWLTVALAFFTLGSLILKGGLNIILGFLFVALVFPILMDNALRDRRDLP